jgi:hypothetical protein
VKKDFAEIEREAEMADQVTSYTQAPSFCSAISLEQLSVSLLTCLLVCVPVCLLIRLCLPASVCVYLCVHPPVQQFAHPCGYFCLVSLNSLLSRFLSPSIYLAFLMHDYLFIKPSMSICLSVYSPAHPHSRLSVCMSVPSPVLAYVSFRLAK